MINKVMHNTGDQVFKKYCVCVKIRTTKKKIFVVNHYGPFSCIQYNVPFFQEALLERQETKVNFRPSSSNGLPPSAPHRAAAPVRCLSFLISFLVRVLLSSLKNLQFLFRAG